MGGVYGYGCNNINPSSSSASPPDEFSLFLRQILLPSSSTPSSSSLMLKNHENVRHPALLSSYIRGNSAAGLSENESDDDDCESEGGTVEAMVEEVQAKPVPSRSSYKRGRTAEVHNLSEKRRRSRINEKMKALQNLIPNSNKTDKASMLDEAIEYLKQLQLQVQILSMRNGLSLHPMCFPDTLPLYHSSDLSNVCNSETSFEPTRSSEHQQLNANNSDTNPFGDSQAVQEFESGTLATVSPTFDSLTTEVKDNLETCIGGRDHSEIVLKTVNRV